MKIKDYFSNDFETSENHYLPMLRSRYYRCKNDEAMDAVRRLAKDERGIIKYDDPERHEINYEAAKYNITATIISTSFTETAIDFKITTYGIIAFGRGAKIIEELYKKLDKMIPFKGVGLYHNR